MVQKRFFMMMHLLRRYEIYVDFLYLMNQHPDTVQANDVLKTEQEAVKQEFETKSVGMNDQDKQKLDQKLAQRIEQKRLELIKPISEKVVAAGW